MILGSKKTNKLRFILFNYFSENIILKKNLKKTKTSINQKSQHIRWKF